MVSVYRTLLADGVEIPQILGLQVDLNLPVVQMRRSDCNHGREPFGVLHRVFSMLRCCRNTPGVRLIVRDARLVLYRLRRSR
jgi:hypothetical protein